MEINGISFEDWAAGAANIAHGMSEDEVCKVLGVELPVWSDANLKWGEKMADLMATDMSIATKYGEIFQNPKVGKFANSGETTDVSDALSIVPDIDTFMKIQIHTSKAAEVGLDAASIFLEYGLTLQQWGQLGMHYSPLLQTHEAAQEMAMSVAKWTAHFDEMYKDHAAGLGDDIDF